VHKVAFLTTIFPMKDKYLLDFFNSLVEQSYKFFDIVVVNDGYEKFRKIREKYNNLTIIELPCTSTPAKNREYGINYCLDKKYDILIFGDSDDYFSNNRVALSMKYLETHDIVVNDLTLFNEQGVYINKYISNRLDNNSEVDYQFIQDKNIFGLSNTAVNLNILKRVFFDKEMKIVDWFLFKQLLKSGKKAIFTNKIITFYRQHLNNTIGLTNKGGSFPLWWEVENIKGKIHED
jgi:glycosyltransferase involved in cell wall biosynthesis